jgi:hypothetical protein
MMKKSGSLILLGLTILSLGCGGVAEWEKETLISTCSSVDPYRVLFVAKRIGVSQGFTDKDFVRCITLYGNARVDANREQRSAATPSPTPTQSPSAYEQATPQQELEDATNKTLIKARFERQIRTISQRVSF